MMRGIDVSVYSGPISVEKWRKVKADGYDLAIVGLFHGRTPNWYAAQQTETAWEADMEVAYYALLAPWTGYDGKEQVRRGLEQAAGIPCDSFFAIDCEIDGIDERMIHQGLEEASRAGDPIIYTADWWWRGHFGNPTTFSHLPLWTAQFPLVLPNQPNLLDIPKLYGGWTREKLVGWQWKGTTDLCGISCDLNVFDEAFVKGKEMIVDQFAGLRGIEMHLMSLADAAHGVTLASQIEMISAIRHNEGESPDEEMLQWRCLAKAYRAEIKAIQEALKRCSCLGRPG